MFQNSGIISSWKKKERKKEVEEEEVEEEAEEEEEEEEKETEQSYFYSAVELGLPNCISPSSVSMSVKRYYFNVH